MRKYVRHSFKGRPRDWRFLKREIVQKLREESKKPKRGRPKKYVNPNPKLNGTLIDVDGAIDFIMGQTSIPVNKTIARAIEWRAKHKLKFRMKVEESIDWDSVVLALGEDKAGLEINEERVDGNVILREFTITKSDEIIDEVIEAIDNYIDIIEKKNYLRDGD